MLEVLEVLEVRGRVEWADLVILDGLEGVEGLGLRLVTGLPGHILRPRDLLGPDSLPAVGVGPTRFSELPRGDWPLPGPLVPLPPLLVPAILFVDLVRKLLISPEPFSRALKLPLSTDRDLPPYLPGFNLEGDGDGDGEVGVCDLT